MPQPIIEPNFEGEEMKIPEGTLPVETPPEPPKSLLNTTVIVLLFLALIAIFAGLAYWYNIVMSTPIVDPVDENPPSELDSPMTDMQTESLYDVSTSDEIDAIEADIEDTNLDDLDRELAEIDAELEAEMGVQ